jgi:TonB-dependent starch-binding outer membrane protein SusC
MRNLPQSYVRVARLILSLTIFVFFSFSVSAQKTVSGSVRENSTALVGATVEVAGTTVATKTDAAGAFSITLPAGRNMLRISFADFVTQQLDVNNLTSLTGISVSLIRQNASLNEVVVTGYSTQRKKDITGSVAVVNVKNLKQVPGTTAESILQGQASGVSVINSGSPGEGSNLRIRGITSLGSADPLVIVDGTQMSMHDLNPNDIESIQVLKDAGAAAIYGVQGSNGVIIITTKKGRGRATINYDAFVGTQRPLKDGFNVANAKEYGDVLWAQAANSGAAPSNAQYGHGATPVVPVWITPAGSTNPNDPAADPATYNINSHQITRANQAGTDWFHEIFKPATIQNHTLSAQGSSDKTSYFFSLNYLNQQGTLINTYLKRYAVRANTIFNVKNNIRVGENAYIFFKDNPKIGNQNEGNAISNSYREPAIIPVYDIMGNFAGTKSGGLSNAGNPVAQQKRQADNKGNDWQVNGNVFAEVDFLKHFTAKTVFGGTFDNYYYYFFSYTAYENAEGNTNPNAFTEGSGFNSTWVWTNTAQYKNNFGKHAVTALIGTEAKKSYNRGTAAGRSNYYSISPNYWTLNTGDPSTASNSGGSPSQIALNSYFGRVDYAYDDRYLLSAVVRRDGASVFEKDHRWGTFPSVTAGWRISEETFMKNVTWLNDLKLRGGWGKLGSISNIDPTNPYNLYASGAGYSYYAINGQSQGATQGFFASQFGNVQTTWEEDIVTNVGLDATIMKNKLDFSVEWYKKKISGLLYRRQSAIGDFNGGATQPFINGGNIENKGIDASITYHGTVKKDLKFDVTGTITSYRSKVVSLPEGYKYVDQNSGGSTRIGAFVRTQPGQAIGAFYGYKVIGYFKDAADIAASPSQVDSRPGRFKYADIDGDKVITDKDKTFFGNPNPKFTYGINLAVSYKDFDFSAFFYGSAGNDVINYIKYWVDFPQVFGGNISKDAVNNSWTPTNLNPKVPILEQAPSFSTTTVFNSWYMEKGSYLRCKQMQLGYTLPSSVLKRFGIDRLRVYLQAANLFTITKYTGLDPELQGSNLGDNSNFGIDFGNYPANQKNYNIGVNLTF